MPKHKFIQRRNDWNSGFEHNTWQNPDNTHQNGQMNMGQNYFNNPYFEPNFHRNMTQTYSNNIYDPRFQNNMAQNHYNGYFNPNYNHGNFSQNYPGSFTQNGQQFMKQSYKNNGLQRNTMKNFIQGNIQQSTVQINTLNDNFKDNQIDDETNVTINCVQQNIKKTTEQAPCKTESEYQRLNGHKLSKETKLKNRAECYAIKTQLYNEKGYILQESLYKNPYLFQAHSDSDNDQPNSNEVSDKWTDSFWKKHKESSLPDKSRSSQNVAKVSTKNQNPLEKSLNKMLAQPVEMSKGMSLLQKMGWTGGGLGKDGDGIVEPIAPKATYAVKPIGLGHLTEKMERPKENKSKEKSFSQISKHQLKSPEFQNNFWMNVLLYVLKFVKNDAQDKIVFDPRLTKMVRKRIHIFVGKLRESSSLHEFYDIKHLTAKHFALIKDIWAHNCYELWTESEGEGQDRSLCLYKKAPAHVYLVTPEDLVLNDENEANDGSDGNNVQDSEKLRRTHVKDETKSRYEEDIKDADKNTSILPKIKTEDHENNNMCDEIVKKIEINANKLDIECRNDQKDSFKVENISTIDLCDEIERKMDINAQTIENNDQNSIVKEVGLETREDVTIKTETLTNGKDNNKTNILGQNKLESYKNVNFVKGMDLNKTVIRKIKPENDKKFDGNEKSIKNYENGSTFEKILKYFKEFLEDDVFKEFRFLGSFSDEELMNINLFFDICMELDDGHSEEKDELLKLFGDGSLEVLEDNNGKRFIHKKEHKQELLQSEESSESVICLDK